MQHKLFPLKNKKKAICTRWRRLLRIYDLQMHVKIYEIHRYIIWNVSHQGLVPGNYVIYEKHGATNVFHLMPEQAVDRIGHSKYGR